MINTLYGWLYVRKALATSLLSEGVTSVKSVSVFSMVKIGRYLFSRGCFAVNPSLEWLGIVVSVRMCRFEVVLRVTPSCEHLRIVKLVSQSFNGRFKGKTHISGTSESGNRFSSRVDVVLRVKPLCRASKNRETGFPVVSRSF